MPFVPVPKDLTKVKSKVAFNLTKRQLVCFSAGGLLGVPTYLICREPIGTDLAALLMITLMIPFFFLAMYEKDGQPFEKVMQNYIRVRFQTPAARPYQTHNFYAELERQSKLEKEATRIAGKTKKAKETGGARKKVKSSQTAIPRRKSR